MYSVPSYFWSLTLISAIWSRHYRADVLKGLKLKWLYNKHTCTQVLTHARARARTHTHTHTHTHVRMHTHPQTHARTHTCTCTHARTRARTHARTHTHTHACTHARTHTHTHTHTHYTQKKSSCQKEYNSTSTAAVRSTSRNRNFSCHTCHNISASHITQPSTIGPGPIRVAGMEVIPKHKYCKRQHYF